MTTEKRLSHAIFLVAFAFLVGSFSTMSCHQADSGSAGAAGESVQITAGTGLVADPITGSGTLSEEWKAPARAAKKKNPFPADEKSLTAGKKVYVEECLSCHGEKGKGDGPGAKDLKKHPLNFTTEAFHAQTDGALFWKITEGRKPMPAYAKAVTEEDRWHVINYLRTLNEKKDEKPD